MSESSEHKEHGHEHEHEEEVDSSRIFNPNLTLNDGKTYLITKTYEDDDETPDPVALDPEEESVNFMHYRILTTENWTVLTKPTTVNVRNNLLTKIQGFDQLLNLRELELYDNQITKIENLDTLVNLE